VKIDFPKIVRPIPLSEYAPEMTITLYVWVNPPRSMLQKFADFADLAKELDKLNELETAVYSWFSEILSQGSEDTHVSTDDARKLAKETRDTDPRFWPWLQQRCLAEISKHRNAIKNA
jgi:hypothetical protein